MPFFSGMWSRPGFDVDAFCALTRGVTILKVNPNSQTLLLRDFCMQSPHPQDMQTSVAGAALSHHVPESQDQVQVIETMELIAGDLARLGSAQLVLGDFSHYGFSVYTSTFSLDFSCRQFDRNSEMASAARQRDSVAPLGLATSFAHLAKEERTPRLDTIITFSSFSGVLDGDCPGFAVQGLAVPAPGRGNFSIHLIC